MFSETKKSTSVEVTHRLDATLVARCSDSDFVYEIESLKNSIDTTSLPIRQTIEFIVTMRPAESEDQNIIESVCLNDERSAIIHCSRNFARRS